MISKKKYHLSPSKVYFYATSTTYPHYIPLCATSKWIFNMQQRDTWKKVAGILK